MSNRPVLSPLVTVIVTDPESGRKTLKKMRQRVALQLQIDYPSIYQVPAMRLSAAKPGNGDGNLLLPSPFGGFRANRG